MRARDQGWMQQGGRSTDLVFFFGHCPLRNDDPTLTLIKREQMDWRLVRRLMLLGSSHGFAIHRQLCQFFRFAWRVEPTGFVPTLLNRSGFQQHTCKRCCNLIALTMHERKRAGGIGRKAPGPPKETLDLWLPFLYPLQNAMDARFPCQLPQEQERQNERKRISLSPFAAPIFHLRKSGVEGCWINAHGFWNGFFLVAKYGKVHAVSFLAFLEVFGDCF